jgi:hypothetical protein
MNKFNDNSKQEFNRIKYLKQDENILNKNYNINNNDIKSTNNSHIQTELSTMNDSSNKNTIEDESLENDINYDLANPIIKEEISNFRFSPLYGNNINVLNPKKIGKLYSFLYINNKPLIVIGSECKNIIIIYSILI